MQGQYRTCSSSGRSAGSRSRGFVVPIETLFASAASAEARLDVASGEGTRGGGAGQIVAAMAAAYGFTRRTEIMPEQMYGVAYAVLGIDDFVAHNHAGAGTLFPDQAIMGSRPRVDDLMGSTDTEDADAQKALTGSCGLVNTDIPSDQWGKTTEGGKTTSMPLNSADGICAVFSGSICGDQTFDADGKFDFEVWHHLNSGLYNQFVNQYNFPGHQFSQFGGDQSQHKSTPRPPKGPPDDPDLIDRLDTEWNCWHHFGIGGCGYNSNSPPFPCLRCALTHPQIIIITATDRPITKTMRPRIRSAIRDSTASTLRTGSRGAPTHVSGLVITRTIPCGLLSPTTIPRTRCLALAMRLPFLRAFL